MEGRLQGKVQLMITDVIMSGVHHVTPYKEHGIIAFNKVAKADAQNEECRDVLNSKGEQIKTLPVRRVTHHRDDGTLVEVDWDQDGFNLVMGTPKRLQVKSSNELTAQGFHCRMSVGYTVMCRHGEFEVWISPHKESGDDGRKISENYRVCPEGGNMFKALCGAGRNTSEGGKAHHKVTYPHKRAQAVGRIPILLDVHLNFIYDTAKSWHFQTSWKIVDRLVHGGEADVMEPTLELAS